MKVDRKKLTRVEDQPEQGWVSWATGGWFQSKSKSKAISEPDESSEGDDLRTQFKQEMTPEEQQKLFAAIDYEENAPPNDYPEHYVETKVDAILERLLITFEHNRGGKSHTTVLTMKLDTLKAHLLTRQAYRAIKYGYYLCLMIIYYVYSVLIRQSKMLSSMVWQLMANNRNQQLLKWATSRTNSYR
jgi:hypothetical protein